MQREQQKDPIQINSKLSAYISDWGFGYYKQDINEVEIICYDIKLYVPKTMHRRVLDWYHFYLDHPCGIRLSKTDK